MKPFRRFLRLNSADQWLVVKCGSLLGVIWLGLWFLPFRIVRRLLGKVSQVSTRAGRVAHGSEAFQSRAARAISAVGSYLPRPGNCLAQALTTQVILGRHGQPAVIRIGVARAEDGEFKAHAWVEVDGNIVIGGDDVLARFVPLPPLKEETR